MKHTNPLTAKLLLIVSGIPPALLAHGLGVSITDSILVLTAFLPLLIALSGSTSGSLSSAITFLTTMLIASKVQEQDVPTINITLHLIIYALVAFLLIDLLLKKLN